MTVSERIKTVSLLLSVVAVLVIPGLVVIWRLSNAVDRLAFATAEIVQPAIADHEARIRVLEQEERQ